MMEVAMSRLGNITRISAFITAAMFGHSASAQDVCAPALNAALKDTMTKHSAFYMADALKWQYDGVSYSSLSERQKTEFGLMYDSLDLDFTSDGASAEEKYNAFIQRYEAQTERHSSEYITVSNIRDKLVEEWGKCRQYVDAKLFIAFDPAASRRHLTVQLRYMTGTATEFQGVETYNMSCMHNGIPVLPDTKMPLHTQMITLNCVREYDDYQIGGVTTEFFPEASVTVKTIEGSSRYEFVSMIDGPAKTKFEAIDHSIADVSVDARQRVNGVQTNLDLLSTALGSWSSTATQGARVGANRTNYEGTSQCPQGQYVVGVGYGGAQGSHCNGCVATYYVICRPLNR